MMTHKWAGFPVNTKASQCPRAHIFLLIPGFVLEFGRIKKPVTMRFSFSLILSTLMVVYLLSDNVLGEAERGRYMWLKCKLDGEANCVKNMGPLIDLPAPQRLPARATRDIHPVETSEETEESGDGSGDFLSREVREISMNEWPQQSLTEEEGSGVDYVAPESVKAKLSARDLREDNMIE